ncbi:hypothetical protein V8C26DRAFT_127696 [Trichoderma gracile]
MIQVLIFASAHATASLLTRGGVLVSRYTLPLLYSSLLLWIFLLSPPDLRQHQGLLAAKVSEHPIPPSQRSGIEQRESTAYSIGTCKTAVVTAETGTGLGELAWPDQRIKRGVSVCACVVKREKR